VQAREVASRRAALLRRADSFFFRMLAAFPWRGGFAGGLDPTGLRGSGFTEARISSSEKVFSTSGFTAASVVGRVTSAVAPLWRDKPCAPLAGVETALRRAGPEAGAPARSGRSAKTLRTLEAFPAFAARGTAVVGAHARAAVLVISAFLSFGPFIVLGARRVRGRGFAALQLGEARGRNVGGGETFFQQPFDQLVLPLELAALQQRAEFVDEHVLPRFLDFSLGGDPGAMDSRVGVALDVADLKQFAPGNKGDRLSAAATRPVRPMRCT